MKYAMASILGLFLLLAGCGAAAAQPEPAAAAIPPQDFGGAAVNPPQPLPSPGPAQAGAAVEASPLSRGTPGADEDRGAIVRTMDGAGIDEVSIYAELCTLVLEPSATGRLEAVFSYPDRAAANYENHFDLAVERAGGVVSVSTSYKNQRWDTAFASISGFDGNAYREQAVLTVRLPVQQYSRVGLHLVTPGSALGISGVDTATLDIRISTGDVVIRTDRAYEDLSIAHTVGNVTLCAPQLGRLLQVAGKIGVFTLSLPQEPADVLLDIRYGGDTAASGDEAIFVLPASWEAAASGRTVHYARGDASHHIRVENELYGVFAVEIDGAAPGKAASAR